MVRKTGTCGIGPVFGAITILVKRNIRVVPHTSSAYKWFKLDRSILV